MKNKNLNSIVELYSGTVNILSIYGYYVQFKKLKNKDREILINSIPYNLRSKLLHFAIKMATEVLKVKDKEKCFCAAIFSIVLENFIQDPRDSIGILSLLNHSADELDFELNIFLNEAVLISNKNAIKHLTHWINRKDKSIHNFGFRETRDANQRLVGYNSIRFNI